jgi:hypothetical protein
MELVWNLWVLLYNHANINSHSGRTGQVRILGNLSDFSKPVWAPNNFGPNSKEILLAGILIQFLF